MEKDFVPGQILEVGFVHIELEMSVKECFFQLEYQLMWKFRKKFDNGVTFIENQRFGFVNQKAGVA